MRKIDLSRYTSKDVMVDSETANIFIQLGAHWVNIDATDVRGGRAAFEKFKTKLGLGDTVHADDFAARDLTTDDETGIVWANTPVGWRACE